MVTENDKNIEKPIFPNFGEMSGKKAEPGKIECNPCQQ